VISALVVHKDDPGFSVGPKERRLGIRGSPTREIYFEDCRSRPIGSSASPAPASRLLWISRTQQQSYRAGVKQLYCWVREIQG